jgi:hypothetical protein
LVEPNVCPVDTKYAIPGNGVGVGVGVGVIEHDV